MRSCQRGAMPYNADTERWNHRNDGSVRGPSTPSMPTGSRTLPRLKACCISSQARGNSERRRETTTRSDQERPGGSRHREGEASWRLFCERGFAASWPAGVRCRWRQERGLDLHDIDLHLLEINPAGSASRSSISTPRNETFSKASKATSDHRGLLGIARDY